VAHEHGECAERPRRVALTLRGRLLADTVVRRLLALLVLLVLLVSEPR
jgi:hypothetical protein